MEDEHVSQTRLHALHAPASDHHLPLSDSIFCINLLLCASPPQMVAGKGLLRTIHTSSLLSS